MVGKAPANARPDDMKDKQRHEAGERIGLTG